MCCWLNPGSVGRPGDHDPRASYAIMDMDTFDIEVRRIEYDVEAAIRAVGDEKGIPDVVADMIRKGLPSNEVKEVSPRRSSGANIRRAEIDRREADGLNIDHGHTQQVMKLAMELFKGLRPLHDLGSEDRFILEAGCLLHDIGLADGDKAHNRASYRMIMTETVLPFNDRERQMIACLARYHRKRPPKDEDEGF